MHHNPDMTTSDVKKIKRPRKRLASQVIARVSEGQRAQWDRIGGADWLRSMLDAIAANASQKRSDPA